MNVIAIAQIYEQIYDSKYVFANCEPESIFAKNLLVRNVPTNNDKYMANQFFVEPLAFVSNGDKFRSEKKASEIRLVESENPRSWSLHTDEVFWEGPKIRLVAN